jgi:ABC-type Zn2+ transport system substrate-binding protein/surface adhesin
MTRLLSIMLSSLLLLQSLHLSVADLVQLDELLEHASYHRQEFGDSFLTFLEKHYGDLKADHEKNQQEERHDHEQLPFQQLPHQLLGQTHFIIGQRFHWNTPQEGKETQLHQYYYLLQASGIFSGSIFQPPRQA